LKRGDDSGNSKDASDPFFWQLIIVESESVELEINLDPILALVLLVRVSLHDSIDGGRMTRKREVMVDEWAYITALRY